MTRGFGRANPMRRPAMGVVRKLAMSLVKDMDSAVARLADPGDEQALHDVRVALRRLRGWLHAFRSLLQPITGRRRQLKSLTHATNMARDAEVGIEWLRQLQPGLEPRARSGVAGFARNLNKLRDKHYRRVQRDLPHTWRKISVKLSRDMAMVSAADNELEFLEAFVSSLNLYIDRFDRALVDACRLPKAASIHRLRIAGKDIRYLVEIILPWYPQAKPLLRDLRALHHDAGRIQDLQRLIELSEAVFPGKPAAGYRRLLRQYTDISTGDRRLRVLDVNSKFLPLLLICRSAAKQQLRHIVAFQKTFLRRKPPACVTHMHGLAARLNLLIKN